MADKCMHAHVIHEEWWRSSDSVAVAGGANAGSAERKAGATVMEECNRITSNCIDSKQWPAAVFVCMYVCKYVCMYTHVIHSSHPQ